MYGIGCTVAHVKVVYSDITNVVSLKLLLQ